MELKYGKSYTVREIEEIKKQEKEIDLKKKKIALANIAKSSKEKNKEKKDRFYLPVLNINDLQQWPSEPLENRRHFTDETALDTCLNNCCGVPGVSSACCQMDPENLEHVLGPLDEEWIKDILRWFKTKGVYYNRSDIVIDYEEGKIIGEKFFTSEKKIVFQDEKSYPILRFQIFGPRYSCKFLSPQTGKCTIYSKRPDMCKNYLCQYVKTNFLVRLPDHPNKYVKVR